MYRLKSRNSLLVSTEIRLVLCLCWPMFVWEHFPIMTSEARLGVLVITVSLLLLTDVTYDVKDVYEKFFKDHHNTKPFGEIITNDEIQVFHRRLEAESSQAIQREECYVGWSKVEDKRDQYLYGRLDYALNSGALQIANAILDLLENSPTIQETFEWYRFFAKAMLLENNSLAMRIFSILLSCKGKDVEDSPYIYETVSENYYLERDPIIASCLLGRIDIAQAIVNCGWDIPSIENITNDPGPETNWTYVNEGDHWGPLEISREYRYQNNDECSKRHFLIKCVEDVKKTRWRKDHTQTIHWFYQLNPRIEAGYSMTEQFNRIAARDWRRIWPVLHNQLVKCHGNLVKYAKNRYEKLLSSIIIDQREIELPTVLIRLIMSYFVYLPENNRSSIS